MDEFMFMQVSRQSYCQLLLLNAQEIISLKTIS